jgi:acetyl-CoA carboxylase biotin carboxyl carrier protein
VTLNSDKKNHHEFGHAPVVINHGAPPGPATLDAVCRSVSELAKAAPKPPRRIRLQHGQTTVEVEWPDPEPATIVPAIVPVTATPAAAPEPPSDRERQDGLRYVHAPMVGTFYHSPEPGAPPFVSVGDVVRRGQPIGILEVMKMMSPVKADSDGQIVEIIAPDAQSVEYQERLIAIAPANRAEE